jgi:hypothetical protein
VGVFLFECMCVGVWVMCVWVNVCGRNALTLSMVYIDALLPPSRTTDGGLGSLCFSE